MTHLVYYPIIKVIFQKKLSIIPSLIKMINAQLFERLIFECQKIIAENQEYLTELDAKIGDADHGNNLNRGFQAIADLSSELSKMTPSAALKKAGMTLVMKVGGASGPLYGSFLMGMAKHAKTDSITLGHLPAMFWGGIEDVQKRGKSEAGQKTMLDTLIPAAKQLEQEIEQGSIIGDIIENIMQAAGEGCESTKMMKALKGRASYLGERSIGHLDPGAMSSFLLIKAVCSSLDDKTK